METKRTKIYQLIQLNKNLYKVAEDKIFNPIHDRNQRKVSLLIYSMAKGTKTHRAICLLCKKGFGQNAAMLGRSLFELLVNMGYIFNKDTEDRMNRYISKHFVISSKYSDDIQKAVKEGAKRVPNYPSENEMKKLTDEAIELTTMSNEWSGKPIGKMAEEIQLKKTYDLLYRLISNIIHSTSSSFTDYFRFDTTNKNGILIDAGPSDKWVAEALSVAFTSYFHLCELWNQKLDWGIKNELKELEERFFQIVE